MTIALAAVGAALATLVVTLLFQWAVRRSSDSDDRLTQVVRELEARMDEMVHELSGALEQSQLEGQRTQMLGELAGSIDLDEVLTRVLEAAGAVDGVDATLVTLSPQPGGEPIVATLGLTAEEAERQPVTGPPNGRPARTITISYEYAADEPSADGEAIRSGVAVPLPGETGPLGLLTIFTRSSERLFGEEEVRELEELALRAGPAIENARRFREARNLALIIFDLDDFKAINDRIGHLAGDGVLAEAAERIREVVRSADIECRVGGDEFAVILPESTLADADQLYARLQTAVSARPVGQAGPLTISAGVAELQPDDDAIAFFQRADHALYGAKEAGKGQVVAASLLRPQGPSGLPPPTIVAPPEEPPRSQAG